MEPQVAAYRLDDSTVVKFEVDPLPGFEPASADRVVGRVQEAIAPAVETARVVLEKIKKVSPDEVEVKFGVKVTGKMDWLVAKASTDANFEIKLIWRPGAEPTVPAVVEEVVEEQGQTDGVA